VVNLKRKKGKTLQCWETTLHLYWGL